MTLKGSKEMDQIKSVWIGALGAAVGRVNILVSRFFAYSLDEWSLSYLFLSSRLSTSVRGFCIHHNCFVSEMARAVSGVINHILFIPFARLAFDCRCNCSSYLGLALLAQLILTVLFQ